MRGGAGRTPNFQSNDYQSVLTWSFDAAEKCPPWDRFSRGNLGATGTTPCSLSITSPWHSDRTHTLAEGAVCRAPVGSGCHQVKPLFKPCPLRRETPRRQDRALSPQREPDVRSKSVAALPSGEV